MLRRSSYLTAFITALTTLVAVMAHGQPLPAPISQIKPQNLSEPSANAVMPVCYIQLENGQLRDLRSLCGKRSINLVPFRGVQRSVSQPNPDRDDDESPSTATSKPQTTPASTLSPTQAMPQPSASPSPRSIGRPVNQPSPASPSTLTSTPHPLAIPDDKPSRD